MSAAMSTKEKLREFYELVEDIGIAMLTTRRPDGMLVTRPMATQELATIADLWFVTNIETQKIDEIESDPHVNLGYYNDKTKEWVSVSGLAEVTQDRDIIRRLHKPDWTAWFEDEGGNRNGGPDDPRLALILVEAHSVQYMKSEHSRPVVLFEIARGMVTGDTPDIGRVEHLAPEELHQSN